MKLFAALALVLASASAQAAEYTQIASCKTSVKDASTVSFTVHTNDDDEKKGVVVTVDSDGDSTVADVTVTDLKSSISLKADNDEIVLTKLSAGFAATAIEESATVSIGYICEL